VTLFLRTENPFANHSWVVLAVHPVAFGLHCGQLTGQMANWSINPMPRITTELGVGGDVTPVQLLEKFVKDSLV